MRRVVLAALAGAALFGQAGPTERQKVDPAAARRGRQLYAQYCINCHGALAKGTADGPDLIRSPLVLRDRLGNEIGPALKRLAGHKADLNSAQMIDITHFLKEQIEATAKDRNADQPPNVLTGERGRGAGVFQRRGRVRAMPFGDGRSGRDRAQIQGCGRSAAAVPVSRGD